MSRKNASPTRRRWIACTCFPTAQEAKGTPGGFAPRPYRLPLCTRDDRPAAGFPLAVNPEGGGKAIWHDVVTFDETAGQLHEAFEKRQITKGKPVDVTGQPVVLEEPKANGGVKKTREFHATAVVRVQATRPGR
jgi:hypothetical protein